MIQILETILTIAIAKKTKAEANLNIYLNNPAGVGEHPDVIGEADKLMSDIVDADGKIIYIQKVLEEIKSRDEESSDS